MRYYCTRDSSPDGTLSDVIEAWPERPTRFVLTTDGGALWFSGQLPRFQMSTSEFARRFRAALNSDAVCMYFTEVAP